MGARDGRELSGQPRERACRRLAARAIPGAVGAALLGLLVTSARAQDYTGDEIKNLTLEQLLAIRIDIASKEADTIAVAPSSVTVFTRGEIRMLGVRYLAELLQLVPGFDVRRFREPLDLVDVRGIGGQQFNERVLIMMDGVRLGDVYNGGSARATRAIRLDNVERVEIIRGPGSALYGTHAFAAVVNIVTQRAKLRGATATADYGINSAYNISLRGQSRFGDHGLSLFGAFAGSDGQSADVSADTVGHAGTARNPYREFYGSAKYDRRALQVDVSFGRREDTGFITFGEILGDTEGTGADKNPGTWMTSSANYRHKFSDRAEWVSKLYTSYAQWGRVTVKSWPAGTPQTGAHPSGRYPDGLYSHPRLANWRYGLDTYGSLHFGDHHLIVGLAGEHDNATGDNIETNGPVVVGNPYVAYFDNGGRCTAGDPDYDAATDFCDKGGRYVFAAYAQYDWKVYKGLSVTAGVRYDHYNDFGHTVNPRGAIVYAGEKDRYYVKLIYGSAFRAPSYRELFAKRNPVVNGDPASTAETLWSVELSGGLRLGRVFAGLSAFNSRLDDLIQPAADEAGVLLFRNRGALHTYGLETEVRVDLKPDVNAFATYTRSIATNTVTSALGVETDYDTPFVARNIANLGLRGRALRHVEGALYAHYSGGKERDSTTRDPRPPVDGYVLLNAHLTVYGITKGLDAYLVGRNLLDQDVRTPSSWPPKNRALTSFDDIPGQGLEVYVGIRYRY